MNNNKIKEIEDYLNDFDNLYEIGAFPKESIKEYTFHHKEMNLKDFMCKGREYIREYLMSKKNETI